MGQCSTQVLQPLQISELKIAGRPGVATLGIAYVFISPPSGMLDDPGAFKVMNDESKYTPDYAMSVQRSIEGITEHCAVFSDKAGIPSMPSLQSESQKEALHCEDRRKVL
jgi:hypothetical protein